MKHLLLLLLLFTALENSVAQQINLISADQLKQRFSNGKDTLYIVNFWATWCKPCVKELPNFEQLGKINATVPLKILLVSLDFPSKMETLVKPFVNKMKLENEVAVCSEAVTKNFIRKMDAKWTGALPATLFVYEKKQRSELITKSLTYNQLLRYYHTALE